MADVSDANPSGALRVVHDGDETAPPRRPRRRRPRGRAWVGAVVLVLALGAVAAWRGGLVDRPETWSDGSAHGPWVAVYDGQGRTTHDGDTIELAPQAATSAGETHASLVVSVVQYGDVDFSTDVQTLRQTRTGTAPNPWEVGWVVWHYTSSDSFYYFTLKPNGWELGKADRRYPGAQRFLATGGEPAETGARHTVRVRQVGATVDVWVDSKHVVTSTDAEDPYLRGSVGLYAEDAVVRFSGSSVASASR